MLVYIEGNIGSGKSTFVDLLKKNVKSIKEKKLALITEPVDEWLNLKDQDGRNILEHFYEDQEKWSFAFQMNSFISRIHRIEQEKADINIVERSVFTDKYCFAKNCYESGKMTKIEYDTYCRWNDWLVNHFNVIPNGYIYLRTTPEICNERINGRNREGEEGIPIQYLQKLHDNHDEWIRVIEKGKNIPVLEIDVSDNYLNNEKEQQILIEKVLDFIKSLH